MEAARLLTDLGDAFIATAIAAVVMIWLWARLGWLMALVFGVCFGGVWLSVAALKLAAREWAPPLQLASRFQLSQGAPSGHIALAGTVFGCATAIFLMLDRRLTGLAGAALSLIALATVAVTRITLHAHTVGDVAAGLAVAALGVAAFSRALKVQQPARPVGAGGLLLAMTVAASLALASGVRLSSALFL